MSSTMRIGLGVGLGVGVPLLALCALLLFLFAREKRQRERQLRDLQDQLLNRAYYDPARKHGSSTKDSWMVNEVHGQTAPQELPERDSLLAATPR
jgi:hypothetical protein